MSIELPIEFLPKFDKALKSFDEFRGKVDNEISGINSSFGTLGTAAKAFVALFAVNKIVDGMQAMIAESAEAERAFSEMAGALRAAGDYSERNAAQFKSLADELAAASEFGDDLILSQVKIAKQFNLTNREAAELMRTAVDLAAATDKDLGGAVLKLGQTYDGTAGRLAQMFPQLQNLTKEQLRQGAAVDILGAKYQGSALRALETYAAQVKRLGEEYGELQEAGGDTFTQNKAVIEFFKGLGQTLRGLTTLIEENKVAIADFVSSGVLIFVQSIGIAIQMTKTLVSSLSILWSQLKLAGSGFQVLWQAMGGRMTESVNTARDAWKQYGKDLETIGKRNQSFDSATERVAELANKIEKASFENSKLAKSVKTVADGFDSLRGSGVGAVTDIRAEFEELEKKLKTMGTDQAETLAREFKNSVDILEQARKAGFLNEVRRVEYIGRLNLKYQKDIQDAQRKAYDELAGRLQQIYQSPLSALNSRTNKGGQLGLSDEAQKEAAGGLGGVNSALQGRQGAQNLIQSAITSVASYYMGPVGEIVGQLAGELTKGPENVRKMVGEFAAAIPDLIEGLILALPEVIASLAEKIPEIIDRLIDRLPQIIEALVKALPRVITALILLLPRVIAVLVSGAFRFVGYILAGAGTFITKILEGAGKFVEEIIKGAGRFIEELVKGAGDAGKSVLNLGGDNFWSGGEGAIDDSVPVIGWMKRSDQPSNKGPTQLVIPVQIGNKQLANAIVDLQRLGYRLVSV